jgi:hypothetical protein
MKAAPLFGDRIKLFAVVVSSDAVSIPGRIKTMGSVENTIAGMG